MLRQYDANPDDSFWSFFPSKELPTTAYTEVIITAFAQEVDSVRGKMTRMENKRADRILSDLEEGASSYQKSDLPPINTINAKSAYEHGEVLTDTIATWVKKGYVAGPFDSPPMAGFRVNPLGAVVRNGKVRPILNMSGPKNKSFNDNVNRNKLERLHMGTAKQFSYALKKAGKGAVFSKFDIQDAYKLIPAKKADYRLQGFSWLGKYFVETRMSFGGVPSPCNFDRLGKTKDLVVCLKKNISRNSVFRALDDSPCVGPKDSGIAEKFSSGMRDFCKKTGIPLAPNCPQAEKAFELVTKGTVLGIEFDSNKMEWSLSKKKADKIITRCIDVVNSSHIGLEQLQQLMGSINDLAQMCPLMKFHKREGNSFMKKFQGDSGIILMVPEELKDELRICAKIARSAMSGMPIAESPVPPPLSKVTCYTDAAGASFSTVQGNRMCHDNTGKGVSCIIGEEEDFIQAWTRLAWPEGLLERKRDERGVFYGSKTTTLESVGLLLPLIVFPDLVMGRDLVFYIDNQAVMYGWQSGYVKNDRSASEVLKAAQYLGAFLGATIHVAHVPRMSHSLAKMADELSRKEDGFCGKTNRLLQDKERRDVVSSLLDWLVDPTQGSLTEKLLKEAATKHPNLCSGP